MRRVLLLGAALALLLTTRAYAQSPDCNAAPANASTRLSLPANPFQALPTSDGCWVFVSLPGGGAGKPAHIAVLRRAGGSLRMDHLQSIVGNPTGMVLTHDGHMLIVADGPRLAFLDVQRLTSGRGNAVLGYLDEPGTLGRIYVNVTLDDQFAFVADERAQTITVVDLEKARSSRYNASAIVGKIPVGMLPIAVTFSPSDSLLYTTSEWAPPSLRWPVECKREGAAAADSLPVNPQGAILVIDVRRATRDPAHAVVSAIPAGCSAVRLVLSPSGDRAYVTARNGNALLAFDTRKLVQDPMHALLARVPVGDAPVGIAVIDSGRKVIVTNSNRFAGSSGDQQVLTVIDATKIDAGAGAILGTIAAGAFPREMRVTADGRTLILTNFASRDVQMIDLTHLPIEPVRR